ncbi:hypothetical protein [uncultured Thiothrix sp.]|uniref:hypothetical protein n=1 Tax=uncultured Thiothrix sp. TaxID=223185 RepID=UPI00260EA028|nr:hypothetical protein [uncultured Thiothrix sp.]
MSDVKNTNETNPETTTEGLNVKLNTEAEPQTTANKGHCKREACGDWSKQAFWQHRRRRGKVLLAAFLIGLFGFMLGKATSHHHQWEHSSYQQPMYEGGANRLPMSMILDGIEATPAQRAKAVELMR